MGNGILDWLFNEWYIRDKYTVWNKKNIKHVSHLITISHNNCTGVRKGTIKKRRDYATNSLYLCN